MALRSLSPLLDGLGDAVWRADALADAASASGVALPSGHAALDAQLPGGGWPLGALSEILQPQNGFNEWRLLLPVLHTVTQVGLPGPYQAAHQPGSLQRRSLPLSHGVHAAHAVQPHLSHLPRVVLIGTPYEPFGPGLAAQGLPAQALLWVKVDAASDRLWAAEQALRCAGVAAVLLWLPKVRAEHLRRLQLAAHEHAKLLFVMRPASAQQESSPAVLRLLVGGRDAGPRLTGGRAGAASGADDALCVQVLKRRGPPLDKVLILPARPAGLSVLLALGAGQGALGSEASQPLSSVRPEFVEGLRIGQAPSEWKDAVMLGRISAAWEGGYALDRLATAV
jgi:protein ImuA